LRAIPSEVLVPFVSSGVKKANDFSGLGIKPRNIGPFEAIAMNACKSEIVEYCFAAVLFCNDVIDLKRCGMKWGGQMAILTPSARSFSNPAYEIRVQYA
jgi:hypothetical protein